MQTRVGETRVQAADEYAAVIERAGWTTSPMGILRVEGRDRITWLHKLITADVQRLGVGQGTRAALLDAKGHFVAPFVLLGDEDLLELLVEPSAAETLYNALRRYIIREQVHLEDVSAQWCTITILGPQAASVMQETFGRNASVLSLPATNYHWRWGSYGNSQARLVRMLRARVPAFDILLPCDATSALEREWRVLPQLSPDTLETLRVEAGLPRWGVDFDQSTLSLEIPNVIEIRIDQGCYVGQEVVARLVHRGHVNRHLRGLRITDGEPPPQGAHVWCGGTEVGNITSSVWSPLFGPIALGYVRREVEIGARVTIGARQEWSAEVIELPFDRH